MKASIRNPRHQRAAFTLVEILVSLAVLTILLLISAQVIGQVQSSWTASNARVSQFREARTAFDILTRNLSQATLNTYVDYDTNYLTASGTATASAPTSYRRKSDLQFKCGPAASLVTGAGAAGPEVLPGHAVFFQAPLGVSHTPSLAGLDRLLCARGYFVQFSSDEFFRPPFLPPGALRYRYRLMEFSPPAEENMIYSTGNAAAGGASWFDTAGASLTQSENPLDVGSTRPVADNILTLIISPRRETVNVGNQANTGANAPTNIATDYIYDSSAVGSATQGSQGTQYLLPPLVRVVLVAIDERSAERLSNGNTSQSPPLGSTLTTPFQNAANLDQELKTLEDTLRARKINYRVFSATIQLRTARWSI